jgi:hypothetical protein
MTVKTLPCMKKSSKQNNINTISRVDNLHLRQVLGDMD